MLAVIDIIPYLHNCRVQSIDCTDSKDQFINDDVKADKFYFDPFMDGKDLKKGDYFEATGSAESHSHQKNGEHKLRRDLSSSVIVSA